MVSEDYPSDDQESEHSQEDLDFALGNSNGIEAPFSIDLGVLPPNFDFLTRSSNISSRTPTSRLSTPSRDSPEPSHPSQLWNRHLNLNTVEGRGRSRLGSPISPRHNLALSEPPNLRQILASVTTTDLLAFSPVYRRAHDENIALQTEIRVLRSLYDSFKDYNRTPPPAQPLPHPHESSRSSFSLPEPYRRSSDATAIPRFNRVDFPMITCWTSAEFKAWNDAYKKLGKDERKGTTQDFIQGEDGQPISPIQTEQIREWIGTAWKECFGAKANDQRFLGKNYSQIDSTYTNQLLHAFIERFPLLGYCDGYFKALYFLNTASYTRKRSIVLTEKKAQIKTELKDSQPILKNTGRPLEVNSKERKTSKKRKESGDDDIYLRKKKKATAAEDSPSIKVAENLDVETNVPSPDYTNQQPQPPLQPYTFTEPPLRSQTCDSQSVTSPSTFIPPGTECTAITMTMEAAELVPGGLTNRAGSGDDGVQEPIKDLVDDISTGTGFDAGASSLLLLANTSHTHASQKTAWPSSRLQPDIPAGSPLKQTSRIYFNCSCSPCKIEHSTRIPTSEQPPPASLTSLTQLLNLPPGSIPPPTLPSVAIPRVQKPTDATAMCGRSVGVSKIGSDGRSVGAIASGGGGGGVDTTNGAGSGLGTGGRGERERGKRAVDGGEDVSRGSVSRSMREISGNAVPDSRIRLAYENARHASWAATNPGKSAKEARRAIGAEYSLLGDRRQQASRFSPALETEHDTDHHTYLCTAVLAQRW
ncbi:hypothetical protein BT69DRAFT_1296479 [Atractiella rhizophila]|nr:hypothetical protein BT69DRAFT_1296479 [Atractiella rhizophila]